MSIPAAYTRWLLAGLVIVVAAGGAVIWWRQSQVSAPTVPEVDLTAAEPEVRTAITRAREAVLAEPEAAKPWGDLGMVLRAHGYELPADDCFREAAARDPNDPRWPYYRGLHAALRDPANALPHLRRAAELTGPASRHATAVHLRLAETLIERGELDEAERYVRGILTNTPDDPRANYDLALVHLARGNPQAAKAPLGMATQSPFTRQKAAARMATAARLLGDVDTAARNELSTRTLPADLPWADSYVTDYMDLQAGLQAKFLQAEQLQAAGRKQDAARQMIAIAEQHPGTRSFVAAGIALAGMGDYPTAERYLRACLQIDPDHTQANYFLAVTLFFQAEKEPKSEAAKARYKECADTARRCLARKPDHGLAYQFLGRALVRLGETTAAVKQLRLGVACRPEMAESHLALAEGLLAAGDREEARKSLATAEEIAGPGNAQVKELREKLGK